MDWLTIGWVLLGVAMVVFIYPRMKQALNNSPKGTWKDWNGVLIPILAVILFVWLLTKLV